MNKCIGCGIKLQNNNKDEIGYTKDLNNKYCERCFKTIHYNEEKKVNNLDNYNGSLASFLNDYMEDKMNSSEAEISELTNLISRTIQVASKIDDLSSSINVREAVFVGIAKNLDRLESLDGYLINDKYQRLLGEKEFSAEEMQEGLSSKDKVKSRINCAICVFAE